MQQIVHQEDDRMKEEEGDFFVSSFSSYRREISIILLIYSDPRKSDYRKTFLNIESYSEYYLMYIEYAFAS